MQLNINTSQWPPEDDGETPREPPLGGAALPGSLPASPSARKTKSRAVRAPHRIDSLRGNKVRPPRRCNRLESRRLIIGLTSPLPQFIPFAGAAGQ